MFLSAVALAALLQAAPVPEAAVAGEKGQLFQRGPFMAPPVDQLTLPRSKSAKSMRKLPAARTPPRITWRRATPLGFVRGPQTARCISNAPELIANKDALTAQSLADMPTARGERAVSLLIDGCAVPVLVEQRAPAP